MSAAPAAAMPLPIAQPIASQGDGSGLLVEVKEHRRKFRRDRDFRHGDRKWDRRYHGPRCSYRLGNCRHYYRGNYYVNPWWLLPPVVGGRIIIDDDYDYPRSRRYGNRHVQWCMDRYRSYNLSYNTWVSYSGDVRQCVSPYS